MGKLSEGSRRVLGGQEKTEEKIQKKDVEKLGTTMIKLPSPARL